MRWQVRPVVPVLEGAAAVVVLVLTLLVEHADPVGRVIGIAAAVLLAVLAARDSIGRTRLSVDGDGVQVIAGFAGRRRLVWTDIESIRVDERTRLGLRSRLLEIDTDDTLVLLSARDLGAEPADVADVLRRVRTGELPTGPPEDAGSEQG